ncbi:MAG: hypothetical protein MUP04_07545 [Anaerolineae bacterium]|nr:hypothetical protein [Anaerolineae bacterium]
MARTNITIGVGLLAALSVVVLVGAACGPAPTPIPTPTATPPQMPPPTVAPSPTPTMPPSTIPALDCSAVVPFAPGCLDQARPPEIASVVTFVGIIQPPGPVTVAAWNPDGTHLAYSVVNPDGWSGVEVREAPEFGLLGRWEADFVSDLTWTPDSQAVLFIFERGDNTSIGLARLGEAEWRDLLPGEKAVLAVSRGKGFVDWLNENLLAFKVGCGTGCGTLYSLDIITGDLHPLVNAWGEPEAPYADVFATVYLFSPDHRWLAATNWVRGLPEAMVLEWPGPAEPLDLFARLNTRYTEAQSWTDSALAFVAYPSGEPDNWPLPPRPNLYLWDADTGVIREVASGAFRAVFSLTGDRLAVLFVGEPRVNEEGLVESNGSTPHLGLLNWPEGRLLAVYPVSTESLSTYDLFDRWYLLTPIWSPYGEALAFQPAGGGLALMNREGEEWPILTGKMVNWVGWGTEGNLALLVDEQIWLVRVAAAAGEIQLTHFATMREGQITEESGAAFHPAWSPDGKQIAFDLTEEIEGLTRETIWVMRSDGSQAHRLLTPPGFGYIRDVAWSPGGERLAFFLGGAEGIDIWACKADGSGLERLVTSADPESIYTVQPALSPDGERIAYTQQIITPRPEGHGFLEANTIWVMEADGSDPNQITEGELPAWSPDGNKIAFARTPEESGFRQIWGRDLSSGEEWSLGPGYEPAWSPTGGWIAFVDRAVRDEVLKAKEDGSPLLIARYESQEVFIMRSDGSDRHQLTNHPAEGEVPEEFISQETTGGPTIYLLESNLTDWSPAWSPDGKSIVFLRQDSEKAESNLWLLILSD